MKKGILNEIREWSFLILAIGTLFIGISTLTLQSKTNPTIEPDIRINLIDRYFFNSHELTRLYNSPEGEFGIGENYLDFKITNLGQKDTNYMNFYVKDPEKEYHFKSGTIENLESLDNSFIQMKFWNQDCSDRVRQVIENNQSVKVALDQCKQVREDIKEGVKNLFLMTDCPGCFERDIQCYSFKICIYSSNESFCGDEEDYFQLKEIDCPDDWWS